MFKRIFKWINRRRQSRRLSDYRATSLAVRLVLTGSLVPSRRYVCITPRVP